jgi:hypothetical protein
MGRKVADCVGLIKAFYWTDESGKFKYNPSTDVTADRLLELATEKGYIGTIPETPGVLVHKKGHVGIYIGNGKVIEARGTMQGVIQSNLSDLPWVAWSKCPYIQYVKESPAQAPVSTPVPVEKKTWEYYIQTETSKELQMALNECGYRDNKGRQLAADSQLGELSWEALTKVLIKQGQKNRLVKVIQKRLLEIGYKLPKYRDDSDFGSETETAVRQFQADRGLVVDAEVGINTLKELFKI